MNYKDLISNALNEKLYKDVSCLVEVPPKQELGDYAFPCFSLAKELKKSPAEIAKDLAEKIKIDGMQIKSTGPYLNFFINNTDYVKNILQEVLEKKENFAKEDTKNKNIVIDYGGPNVAKNMGIHNLRSFVIGQALCNIYRHLGYNVIGINHLGDWGTQFGKLIWALEKWSSPAELQKKGIKFLNEMYVKFHEEAEKTGNEFMEDEARAWFKKIEEKDKTALMWWKLFIEISMDDYNELFDRLGIEFTETKGESFYIPFLDETIKTLEKKGLTSIDDGALVVKFEESDNMPPCLLKKSDGATLYGTRDLAAIMYRLKEYNPSKILYAVDIAQSLHFKQVFKVMELYDPKTKDVLEHIQFGRLSFPDADMSTRKGNIVPLREVLDKAKEKSLQLIKEKNPGLKNKEDVAEKVGTGAVIFEDLVHDRIHNITFEWDKVLDFQGETSPYIQYTIARINSILKKAEPDTSNVDFSLISTEDDKMIAKQLSDFEKALNDSVNSNKPHHVAKYILNLAQTFSNYYAKNQIIQEDKQTQNSRLALCISVKQVLESGLKLLGINSIREM